MFSAGGTLSLAEVDCVQNDCALRILRETVHLERWVVNEQVADTMPKTGTSNLRDRQGIAQEPHVDSRFPERFPHMCSA